MNLNAYDNVIEKIDKTKTWIDIEKHLLLSREIKYRKYYTLVKRFNNDIKSYDYFIVLLDEPPENRISFITKRDEYGRIKIRLNQIFYESNLSQLDRNCNIMINHVDKQEDGDVYQLDI